MFTVWKHGSYVEDGTGEGSGREVGGTAGLVKWEAAGRVKGLLYQKRVGMRAPVKSAFITLREKEKPTFIPSLGLSSFLIFYPTPPLLLTSLPLRLFNRLPLGFVSHDQPHPTTSLSDFPFSYSSILTCFLN